MKINNRIYIYIYIYIRLYIIMIVIHYYLEKIKYKVLKFRVNNSCYFETKLLFRLSAAP